MVRSLALAASAAVALGAWAPAASAQPGADDSSVHLSFDRSSLRLKENSGHVEVVWVFASGLSGREVSAWINTTYRGGADAADFYVFPGLFSLGPIRDEQNFGLIAWDDDLDDDCESVVLEIESSDSDVTVGGPMTIWIEDVDGAAVECGGDSPSEPSPSPPPEPRPPEPEPPPLVAPEAAFTVDVACVDELCRARTGEDVTFTDTSSGTVSRRSWDFDVATARTTSVATTRYAWASPGFYRVTLTVSGADHESTASRVFLVEAANPAGTCEPDGETVCLRDSRYQVRAIWRSPEGDVQPALAAHVGTNDSGLLWFHDADNWEVLIKVLDGCSANGHHWVYAASATSLPFEMSVTDTETGEVYRYVKGADELGALADPAAFVNSCQTGR